jgi:hypothetical protein
MAENEKPTLKNVTIDAIYNMVIESEKLNASFIQGRVRMDEMADAVSRSAAGVIRLGGSISDVSDTMANIAAGSKRNVIATEESVSKLYAAYRLLGISSETLVDNFGEVGIDSSLIGENLENSITYVQSVGLNAKTVMGDVVKNMDMMNRFNFSDGVQGLTKMAAQASMLRFDMNKTADFADKVMSPEKAIDAAAGFQRLGVNIGNLIDPFALMNDAINDPGALQDSIIKATKQFTEFDEKTKTFKINPQGILIMKELYDVTGITAKEMSKTAIAAADLERRVSMINPSLQFDKPEDKELLANMATMGEGGEYIVQLRNDKTNEIDKIKLSEITNEELKALRKQQEDRPKSLEEIQISQLGFIENINSAVMAMAAKGGYGVAGAAIVRGNVLGAERTVREMSNAAYDMTPESSTISKKINEGFENISKLYSDKQSGKISETEFNAKILEIENKLKIEATTFGEKSLETIAKISQQAAEKITGNSQIERAYRKKILGDEKVVDKKDRGTHSQVDISGNLNININAPSGMSAQEFQTYLGTEEFKQKIYLYYEEKTKELGLK